MNVRASCIGSKMLHMKLVVRMLNQVRANNPGLFQAWLKTA